MHAASSVHFAFVSDVLWFAGDLAIKATIVLAAAAAFTWTARRSAAALRHRIWCLAYVALLILPGLSLALPKWSIPIPTASLRAPLGTLPAQAPSFFVSASHETAISRLPAATTEVEPSAAPVIDVQSADKPPGSRPLVSNLVREPLIRKESPAERRPAAAVPVRDVESTAWTDSGLGSGWLCGGLAVLWLLGVGVYSFQAYTGYRASLRLARSAEPVRDRQWLELLEQVQSSLRVPARVELCESDGALTPMVSGVFRPRVLLPREGNRWPLALRRHVLIHELAHVKRHDLPLQLLGRLTTALYWFHPLAWYGLRRMQVEREIACDDYVLTVVERPSDYAAQLLEFARRMQGILHSWNACMASESTLEERVKSMLDRSRSHRPLSSWASQSLFATAVGGAIVLALAQPGVQADVNDRASKQPDRAAATLPGPANDATLIAVAGPKENPASNATNSSSDRLLTVTGRVLLPDGSPAANVSVTAFDDDRDQGATVRTNAEGRFQLKHAFDTNYALHAHTPDSRLQATLAVDWALEQQVEMKLSPTHDQRVLVKSGGKPVAGARVVATAATARGPYFLVKETSGSDGMATLWLPVTEDLQIDAWHPQLGVAQARFVGKNQKDRPPQIVELAFLPPKPHTIRVVDQVGKPVGNLRISLQGRARPNKWFWTKSIAEAVVQTDARGEVTVPWIPAEVDHVNLGRLDRHWKVDDAKTSDDEDHGISTVEIRRLHRVTGRLVMPPRANPEGILITGVGYGMRARGHRRYARARRDGTFTFLAASDHGYWLGISDPKWVGEYWTGVVLTNDAAEPAKITLEAHAAIPLTVHATRGPKAEPWPGVFINAKRSLDYNWTDSHGESQRMNGGVDSGRTTDAKGMAYFGVGRGQYQLEFWWGDSRASQTVNITSHQPVSITFPEPASTNSSRSQFASRDVAGRMTERNKPRPPTPTTTLQAFSLGAGFHPAKVKMFPDGRFTVAAETAHVHIFGTDPKTGLNAFRYLAPAESTSDVALDFVRSAIYGGEVVDEKGKPVVGCSVRLVPEEPDGHYSMAFDFALAEMKVDARGRFRFEQAPANVPLRALVLGLPKKVAPNGWHVGDFKFQLSPGEVRGGEVIEVEMGRLPSAAPATKIAPKRSATGRLPRLIRDARLSSTRVLVVAKGDSSAALHNVWGKLLDEEEQKELLRYLPLLISSEELQAEADLFMRLKLQPPKAGEILFDVLDGEGRQAGTLCLPVRDASSALKQGVEFLKQHAPAKRDARQLLSAAQAEARATGRRVWIIEGETRCGPCFRFSRWLDDHHTLLERDDVFVKLLVGCDDNARDVVESVKGRTGGGIPWFAITDPNGNVLATSDGPSGNIGFPSTQRDKDHFRQMLRHTAQKLTDADVDGLVQSLGH
jgi:beta-lactamase regulating signal transducer with metallopeptidase domain